MIDCWETTIYIWSTALIRKTPLYNMGKQANDLENSSLCFGSGEALLFPVWTEMSACQAQSHHSQWMKAIGGIHKLHRIFRMHQLYIFFWFLVFACFSPFLALELITGSPRFTRICGRLKKRAKWNSREVKCGFPSTHSWVLWVLNI